jgi:DNA-binding transcriptional MocR family regulator
MDRSRTNSALLVVLQRSEPVPLHRQIATSIRDSGGLIFGYATASEQAIAEGVDILARVISQF